MPENVIFGAGPLGLAVARSLVASGKGVRLVNRSGKAPAPSGAEVLAADATDPAAARRACEGAAVVFHCATRSYGQWDKVLPPIMKGIIEGVPIVFVNLLALVAPPMRAVKETMYQSQKPWVVDHSKYVHAFGGETTPVSYTHLTLPTKA